MAQLIFEPMPAREARAIVDAMPAVSQRTFNKLLPEAKGMAMGIAGVTSCDVKADVRDRIGRVLGSETTWAEEQKSIAGLLEPFLGTKADRHAELLLRTHTFRAMAATRYRLLMSQIDVFPFWKYVTKGDGRVRPSHRALGGKIFPAGHSIWQRIFPPWDWGCRCLVVPMVGTEVEQIQEADQKARKDTAAQLVYDGGQADSISNMERLPNGMSLHTSENWTFRPGQPRWTWADLVERYEDAPETWNEFAEWAAVQMIPELAETVEMWLKTDPTE